MKCCGQSRVFVEKYVGPDETNGNVSFDGNTGFLGFTPLANEEPLLKLLLKLMPVIKSAKLKKERDV